MLHSKVLSVCCSSRCVLSAFTVMVYPQSGDCVVGSFGTRVVVTVLDLPLAGNVNRYFCRLVAEMFLLLFKSSGVNRYR